MNYVIRSVSIPSHSFEQALTPLCMGDLNYRDAAWLGIVVGSMVAVMATFIAIFLSGLDSPEVMSSLRSGLVAGIVATVVVTIFAYYRLLQTTRTGKDPEAIKGFDAEGYTFRPDLSSASSWVFARESLR